MKDKRISLSTPNLSINVMRNLKECIETGNLSTAGEFISKFEKKTAQYVGTSGAVSTQSGTAGLHLALKVLGVEADDEVIVPTVTFIATVNPVTYLGAKPVFMDCDDSLNMDLDKLEEFCRKECEMKNGNLFNKTTGKRIKVLIVVHIFGNIIDMERVISIAKRYKLRVLEDSAEAFGSFITSGKYSGRYAGTIGDIGVYSFNANKIITTGGGGMIVSDNCELLDKAKLLSLQAKTDLLYFLHDEVGYNYGMTNLQAALGIDQIDRIEEFIEKKIENYKHYKEKIEKIEGLHLIPFKEDQRSNHWFYSIVIDEKIYGMSRCELLQKLKTLGIQTRPLWGLIHTQKPYLSEQTYKIEKAYHYSKNLLNLPCSTHLTKEDIFVVIESLKELKE
jgi:aminotransferase in exopolysaccharide biosynthesis